MKPTHILMTADTLGGVWTYALDLARALHSSARTRVSLATMAAPPSDSQRAEAASVPGLKLYESEYKLEWMQDPWPDVDAAGEWLLGLEQRLHPDLVHVNGYAHGSLGWEAPCVVVAHSCVYSWWNAVHGSDPPPSWNLYRQIVESGLRNADAVVAVSRTMEQELERHYAITGATVIYNSAQPPVYEAVRKEPFVLAAGRVWDRAKNLQTLDAAAHDIDWPVYLAGNPAHPDGGTANLLNCRAIGSLDRQDMNAWLARASVFASPALYEPFGLTVLEAALHGCALVLSDIPTFRELWDGAAFFVPPLDSRLLAAAIDAFAIRPEMRDEYGHRARARAVRYNAQRMTSEYLAVYERAAAVYNRTRGARVPCAS